MSNALSLLLNSPNGQRMDVISLNMMREITENISFARSRYRGAEPDTRRDIDADCGYPRTEELNVYDHYRFMYDREAIASRVVEYLPKQTWKVNPTVYEDEDSETETEFETAWQDLAKALRGPSWFQDEEGSPVWDHLLRADILSGIGHFGIILLGFDDLGDSEDLSKPLKGFEEEIPEKPVAGKRKLLYMREFDESLVQITRYNDDKGSPRYAQPDMYQVTMTDPTDNHVGVGVSMGSANVHWSRVIHVADNLGSSEVFGVPRQRPVFNRLLDLRKLYGGSAEMYWLAAFMGLSLESHPNLGGDISIDATSARQMMQDYMNRLQRYIAIPGMTAKTLAPQVSDPATQIDTQITAICIQLGAPKRKFMGSERGELSSGQDEDDDNGKVQGRQRNYATPRIIVPFIDRLILAGVLPTPEGYSVTWPDLNELSPSGAADVLLKRTQAMGAYVSGGLDSMMEPLDYFTREMGFDDEEAEAITEAVVKHLEKATPNPDPNAEIVPGRQPPESLDAQVEKTTALAKAGAAGMPPGAKGAGGYGS